MTTRLALFGALVVSAGCAHTEKTQVVTVVRDASASATAPATASSADAAAAKKTFCVVYAQEIKKTEDATSRFIAAANGDEQHPNPQWGDPDKWVSDSADGASIIFDYAANTLEAQVTSSLSPVVDEKAKDLITVMRKLSGLYANHQATQIPDVSKGQYGAAAEVVDKLCGIS